jgi:pyruvate formate lyase activating enzyme
LEDSLKRFTGICGWQKNSFIDFPRTVSTVLFFCGCNLRCPYCHNHEIVFQQHCATMLPIDMNEFWSFLEKRKSLIEGVVLSGGEPTIHPDLLKDVIFKIKDLGFKVKLDTNGLLPEVFDRVSSKIDYVAIDVKTSQELYKEKLGCTYDDVYERIESTLNVATVRRVDTEIRITAVPTLLNEDVCHKIGHLVKGTNIYLQNFRNTSTLDPTFKKVEPFSIDEMNKFKQILLKYTFKCEIR